MTRHDEDWLRDTLHSIGPSPLRPADRLASVNARNRRRHKLNLLGAGVGTAVVALIAGAVFGIFGTDRPTRPVEAADSNASFKCPSGSAPQAAEAPGERAVAVRLCEPPPAKDSRPAPGLPSPVLTENVDELFRDRLAVGKPTQVGTTGLACPAIGGVAYAVVFFYPSGNTRTVVKNTGGCGDEGYYDRFLALVADD